MKIKGHPIKRSDFREQVNSVGLCIWCRKGNVKNIAHIISRSLLKSEKYNNKLKISVCEKCNTFWGNTLEDWFLKFTPIGHWKENIQSTKTKKTIAKNFRFVPNFIYLEYFREWIVINHSEKGEILPTQIFLTNDMRFKLFHRISNSNLSKDEVYNQFISVVNNNDYTIYKSDLLDKDNFPRLFCHNDKYILIAKNDAEAEKYISHFIKTDIKNETIEIIVDNRIGKIGEMHIHYRWSLKRYISLSAKIAFEFLTLFKGANYTLHSEFDDFRNSLLYPKTKYDNLSILNVSSKGYAVKRLNYPGWISIGDNLIHDAPIRIPTLILNEEDRFTYSIVIYKYEDFICATVKLFQIEHSKIILAKTKLSLGKIYAVTYDLESDTFCTYQSSDNVKEYDDLILIPYFEKD